LQKTETPKSISNIGKSWKDLFAYPFFALTRQQLKTENNKLNIYWYTQYLLKSTFETIWLLFHRPIGLVELLIWYARVQFYTHQASDYHLSSKTSHIQTVLKMFFLCLPSTPTSIRPKTTRWNLPCWNDMNSTNNLLEISIKGRQIMW
jgi:hypothetical protein